MWGWYVQAALAPQMNRPFTEFEPMTPGYVTPALHVEGVSEWLTLVRY